MEIFAASLLSVRSFRQGIHGLPILRTRAVWNGDVQFPADRVALRQPPADLALTTGQAPQPGRSTPLSRNIRRRNDVVDRRNIRSLRRSWKVSRIGTEDPAKFVAAYLFVS